MFSHCPKMAIRSGSATNNRTQSQKHHLGSRSTINLGNDISGKFVEEDLPTAICVNRLVCLLKAFRSCVLDQLWHLVLEFLKADPPVPFGNILEHVEELVVEEAIFHEVLEFVLMNEAVLVPLCVCLTAAHIAG